MISYNPFSLKGKSILVTGASSGIGKSTAIECSRMGATLVVVGRDMTRLKETMKSLNGKDHCFFQADLTSEHDLDGLVSSLQPLDGVVNSAGIIKRVPLKLISGQTYENLLQTNLISPVILTKKLYKAKLLKMESSIVLISSVGSNVASLGNIMYMSSKGGLNSFMKGAALELAPMGIRINCIEPGMINTNLTRGISDEEINKDIERYPLGRYGTPEEIAFAAVYLLSDASKWTTGSILKIDGGLTLR
jgi:NAD(P)-dependent dehydrogenase (short-subunit alcohol dehydrogenase family)